MAAAVRPKSADEPAAQQAREPIYVAADCFTAVNRKTSLQQLFDFEFLATVRRDPSLVRGAGCETAPNMNPTESAPIDRLCDADRRPDR